MRRISRVTGLRPLRTPISCPVFHPSPRSAWTASKTQQTITTTRSISQSARRLESEDQKRKEMLEALERDRQEALEMQQLAEYDGALEDAPAPATSLGLPPDFSVAPAPEEAKNMAYTPASTSEGLEEVGGLEDWWEEGEHWSSEHDFKGFAAASEKVVDGHVLEVLLRQAVVETLAVRGKAGDKEAIESWTVGGKEATLRAAGVQVGVSESGDVTLSGDLSAVVDGLFTSAEVEEELAADSLLISAEEAREIAQSFDASWKSLPLDAVSKFAVTKRLFQLSGHRIPDFKLALATTPQNLLAIVVQRPKPKKLVDELAQKEELVSLPNVKVYGRRVTPIDKHIAEGRWKVIEEELKKRELPIVGHGKYGKAVEKQWMMGRA